MPSSKLKNSSLLVKLKALASSTKGNPQLAKKIRHKYRLKNTTGYSLNALIDYEDPIEILSHLMIGSEGTLGFISEVVFDTVPDHAHKAVALVFFNDMDQCCLAVAALKNSPAAAVELLDSRSLQAIGDKPGMPLDPNQVAELGHDAAAILVETRAQSDSLVMSQTRQLTNILSNFQTSIPPVFSNEEAVRRSLGHQKSGHSQL